MIFLTHMIGAMLMILGVQRLIILRKEWEEAQFGGLNLSLSVYLTAIGIALMLHN